VVAFSGLVCHSEDRPGSKTGIGASEMSVIQNLTALTVEILSGPVAEQRKPERLAPLDSIVLSFLFIGITRFLRSVWRLRLAS
jgi:hypothetical protein